MIAWQTRRHSGTRPLRTELLQAKVSHLLGTWEAVVLIGPGGLPGLLPAAEAGTPSADLRLPSSPDTEARNPVCSAPAAHTLSMPMEAQQVASPCQWIRQLTAVCKVHFDAMLARQELIDHHLQQRPLAA